MELTIKTQTLQELVSKSFQCVSNNKLIPITSLMNIKVKENKLTLTTTDASNYFYVTCEDKFDCEDFEISILAEIFTKLVQKITAQDITLKIVDAILEVHGNGTYKIEMPLDENGGIIKFPSKLPENEPEPTGDIKLSTVNTILNYNKPALAISMELPSLTNYYCGDKVVTTDQYKICSTNIKMFDKEQLLITPQLMELLGIMSEETINYAITESYILFWDKYDTIFAPRTEGIETFPIAACNGLIDSNFKSKCQLSRTAVEDVLSRLSLFVSPYDKKGIYLTFTKDGLMFSSKKSSGTETVPYISSLDFSDFTCCIDVEMLKSQISAQSGEAIEIHYGFDKALKMVDRNIIQIVAFMQDDRGV